MKKVLILITLLSGFCSLAQTSWTLFNNSPCDITVLVEYSDPSGCPAGCGGGPGCNLPCSGALTTIPSGGMINLPACGSGIIGEICISVTHINNVLLPFSIHTRRPLWNCCAVPNPSNGIYPAIVNCGSGAWSVIWNTTTGTWIFN